MSRPACPTPRKRAHRTEEAAIRQALSLSTATGGAPRVYRCVCRRWHLTRWTPEDYIRKLEQRQAFEAGQ